MKEFSENKKAPTATSVVADIASADAARRLSLKVFRQFKKYRDTINAPISATGPWDEENEPVTYKHFKAGFIMAMLDEDLFKPLGPLDLSSEEDCPL